MCTYLSIGLAVIINFLAPEILESQKSDFSRSIGISETNFQSEYHPFLYFRNDNLTPKQVAFRIRIPKFILILNLNLLNWFRF